MDISVNSGSRNGEIEDATADEKQFKQFDVVTDDSDHFYLKSTRPGKDVGGGSMVAKKIMQEWKILEKNLPESIYVRVYEGRIDLLRAVIIGAAGTPYHDGLFFFDLAFPSDYPTRPPQVHYRSYGLRLNPNLYANGRVCLSLLNTWPGKKIEKWNPSGSTILQVLVSIQALVLNERPYFNEPGHGMWPGRPFWEKKSVAYNEDVFVLSCKTMLFLLRRPPKNFEAFVATHFRERAHLIVSACKAYCDGRVRVGYFIDNDGSSSSSSSLIDVSNKFKSLMEQLYSELVVAFTRNGASLGNFVEQLKIEKITASSKSQLVIDKTKHGIRKKVIVKLKKILGLKMDGQNNADAIKTNAS